MNHLGDSAHFDYVEDRFADLQLLRYRLEGFEQLSLCQKQLVYYLSKATLYGRDITFDQFGKYNIRIRKMLEAVYTSDAIDHECEDFKSLEIYLKRLWFSNGIYHHYGCDKLEPGFSQEWLRQVICQIEVSKLPLYRHETIGNLMDELFPVIFDPNVLPKRVNKADGEDLVVTSACNFYDGVTQEEAEAFYQQQKDAAVDDKQPVSYGLNSTLVKDDKGIHEDVWSANGRYGNSIRQIVYWLEKAKTVAENERQALVIGHLINYYNTGDLRVFNDYCIEWVGEHEGRIDFVNGFIEVYGDPLGLKGSWEGIVEYKDLEATKRT